MSFRSACQLRACAHVCPPSLLSLLTCLYFPSVFLCCCCCCFLGANCPWRCFLFLLSFRRMRQGSCSRFPACFLSVSPPFFFFHVPVCFDVPAHSFRPPCFFDVLCFLCPPPRLPSILTRATLLRIFSTYEAARAYRSNNSKKKGIAARGILLNLSARSSTNVLHCLTRTCMYTCALHGSTMDVDTWTRAACSFPY